MGFPGALPFPGAAGRGVGPWGHLGKPPLSHHLSLVSRDGTHRTRGRRAGGGGSRHGDQGSEMEEVRPGQCLLPEQLVGLAVGPRAQAANSLSGLRGDTPPAGLFGFPLGGTLRHFRTGAPQPPVSGGMCPALPQRLPRSPPLGPEIPFLTEALSSFRSADRGCSQRRLPGSALSASLSAKTRLQPRQPRCPRSAPPHGDAELPPRKPGHLHFPSAAPRTAGREIPRGGPDVRAAPLWARRPRPFHAHALWSLGLRVGFAQCPGSNHPGPGRSLRTPGGVSQAVCPHLLPPVFAKWDRSPCVSLPQVKTESQAPCGHVRPVEIRRKLEGIPCTDSAVTPVPPAGPRAGNGSPGEMSGPARAERPGNPWGGRRGETQQAGASQPSGASERESGRSGQPRRARPPRSHSRGPPWRTGAGTCGVVLQGTRGKGQQ